MGNNSKKYIVILIDGAADYVLDELGGKTPLQVAKKPVIDDLARNGIVGMVKTIPEGIPPGSDTANLSILGYDPLIYSTGRSSLEAVSIGVKLRDDEVTFRCNLVTLSGGDKYEDMVMADYSAGEISTEESEHLISALAKEFETPEIKFYAGVSYRHVIVWKNGPEDLALAPPHDIPGKTIKEYLPAGERGEIVLDMMKKSYILLKEHPVNKKRQAEGKNPANSIWLWGKGKKPKLDSFYDKYGLKGSVISAVDLVKGIGICAGLKAVEVEGATGNIHTNFEGKADAAVNEVRDGQDFVYVHIEAPDECGHQGNVSDKIRSIEIIDEKVIKKIKQSLDSMGVEYRLMILPDHPTPIVKRTHTPDPVPFLIFDSKDIEKKEYQVFDEFYPASSGILIDKGYKLMDCFLSGKISNCKS